MMSYAFKKVCENRSFGGLFAKLVRVDRYDSNILNAHDTSPSSIAFFDYRLAFISFLLLSMSDLPAIGTARSTIALNATEGAGFRAAIDISIGRYWEGETVNAKTDHIAAFAIARALILDVGGSAEERLGLGPHPFWQLERVPLDMVNWPAFNSHRLDVELNSDFMICCDQQVVQKVLGADEAFFWCSSDYLTTAASNNVDSCTGPTWNATTQRTASCGAGAGKNLLSPAPYLLVYWMARHFALLP